MQPHPSPHYILQPQVLSCLPYFFPLVNHCLDGTKYFQATEDPPEQLLDLCILMSKKLVQLHILAAANWKVYLEGGGCLIYIKSE